MIEIKYGAQLLNLVIHDGKTFRSAIYELFPDEKKNFMSANISIALCFYAIKHYFLFENIVNGLGINLSRDKKSLFYICLANNFYKKVIPVNSVNHYCETVLTSEEFKAVLPILKRKENLEEMITFEKDSDFYYATKYNIPIWIIHMWRKQYGSEVINDFLDSLMKIGYQTYSINTLRTSTEKILAKYGDFTSPFENCVMYQGLKRYFNTEEYKRGDYFILRLGYKCLFDQIIDPDEEMLLYSGLNDYIVKEIIVKGDKKQSLNIAVPDLNKRPEIFRFLRENNIKNVNLFEAKDYFSLKAGMSYKVDKVIVFPDSSHFDLACTYPDYLFHFDRDDLDGIIQKEKDVLELCSGCVSDGGLLFYIVDTLNKKESEQIISDFLAKHKDFERIIEKQYLPSHPFSTLFYYAILSKKEESND